MKRLWKYTVGLLIISYWLLVLPAWALPEIKPGFPRLANYFLHWTISENEARELSKYDLVILDAEVQERSRDQIALLRKLNPKIILLAYVPASEIRRDVASLSQIAPLRYKLGAGVPDEWYLKDATGNRLSFWPGTWIVDVAPSPVLRTPSPLGRGEGEGNLQWNEYLPQFVAREILSTGLWDGVFYDNAWDDIVHFARTTPDLDRDGVADNADKARYAWQDGLRAIYRRTAELAPNYFVFENDGPMYAPEVHGVLLENFPRKGWDKHKQELQKVIKQGREPKVAILNATTFNTGARDDYPAMRFGLTTALVFGAHYSYDFGDQDHGQTWWYDEYEAFLGEAIDPSPPSPLPVGEGSGPSPPSPLPEGEGRVRGVYRREFENGIVFVNPTDKEQIVKFPLEVETISGALVRGVTIPSKDGLIVLRPLETIIGAPYENGVFARVFDGLGNQKRAGFYAFDSRKPSGAMVVNADLNGDDVYGDKILIKGPSMAIGDLTGDGVKEIVIGEKGQVKAYRIDGTIITLPFFPFGPAWRGGISVAVGDLNADGFSEIITGAGPGGGPHVRVFSGQGRLLSGGFFAYDPRFRGGVRVAAGDLDGDGQAEIVTGLGPGGGPQVRVFNNKGQAVGADFFAFDKQDRDGVIPIVTDIDKNGDNEIVALAPEM